MTERRKRLIEVAFPLEEVSEHSRREKNVRHGHISTLHIWWARRPLAACRAFIYASLVNDPETEAEREELLKEVADLASWDAVRKPDMVVRPKPKGSGLTGHELLRRARERILRDNDGKPPKLLDPFAGGGAIPLEALRLGCEVEASDLNPVAVLILKGTVEYPQKYGRPLAEQREKRPDDCAGVNGQVPQYIRDLDKSGGRLPGLGGGAVDAYERNPLATDVRYWGNWMLEKAREELDQFYPPDPDGSVPVAYLWSRTVPCPNCGAEMPLIRQYWLARKDKKKVALKPMVDHANKRVDFEVVEGEGVTGDPAEATTSGGDTACLVCRQTVKSAYVREQGRRGLTGHTMTSVVLARPTGTGKTYRKTIEADHASSSAAEKQLQIHSGVTIGGLPLVPDEPIDPKTLGLRVDEHGLDHWYKLFTPRQLLTLGTLTRLVRRSHEEMRAIGISESYAIAATTYVSFVLDKVLNRCTTSSSWDVGYEKVVSALSLQALPIKWDYAESVPIVDGSGGIPGSIDDIVSVIEQLSSSSGHPATATQGDARLRSVSCDAVVTDPPYYDAVDYAGLSDFFYVWLKRAVGDLHASYFGLPVTPKREQAIMPSESGDSVARAHYVDAMTSSFEQMSEPKSRAQLVAVAFAHTASDAWATLLEGLLAASLIPDASWPIDTETQSGIKTVGQARLKTSVWMACRPREVDAGPAFLDDIRTELRREVEGKLLDFWRRGIRGADFFISAIGPALAVFGRHSKVLHPDGSEVSVREFLDIVRQESARVALQQVLHGENLGVIDPATRAYVMWVWSYGKAALDAGEAIAHCLATGADLGDITRPHAFAVTAKDRSKKVVKLRSVAERAREDEELGRGNGARSTPLIDELQHAAYLWGAGKAATDLPRYRAGLGEQRWKALRVLGQAVAECLPDGDEDRRIILGLLGSGAASGVAPAVVAGTQPRLEI